MADAKYRVERGDPVADRERLLQLWERCGFASGEGARRRYDWFYLGNPQGAGRVYLLMADGDLVGALGAGTRVFALPGDPRPMKGAVLVDFVVHPAHRSMFPALQLQRVAREHEMRDAEVVYGLPDVKAAPVFRRLGATMEFTSGNHVRVLRSREYATRLLPRVPGWVTGLACAFVDRWRISLAWLVCGLSGSRPRWEHGALPSGIDDLWQRTVRLPGAATGERDLRFLDWRLAGATALSVLAVVDRRGNLRAYFICRREDDELHVIDLLFEGNEPRFAALLALALGAWSKKIKTLRISFGGSERMRKGLNYAGYLLRDQRPCFLMQGKGARTLPRDWWLTRADEDV